MPHSPLSVGTTPSKVAEANHKRKTISFQNTHATQTLTICDRNGVTVGIVLEQYDVVVYSLHEGDEVREAWYALGSGAATTGVVYESIDEEIQDLPQRPRMKSRQSSILAGAPGGRSPGGAGGHGGQVAVT